MTSFPSLTRFRFFSVVLEQVRLVVRQGRRFPHPVWDGRQ
jgi:hypothetical protein